MLTPGYQNKIIDSQKTQSPHIGTICYGCEDMLEYDIGVAWASLPITRIHPPEPPESQIQSLLGTLHSSGIETKSLTWIPAWNTAWPSWKKCRRFRIKRTETSTWQCNLGQTSSMERTTQSESIPIKSKQIGEQRDCPYRMTASAKIQFCPVRIALTEWMQCIQALTDSLVVDHSTAKVSMTPRSTYCRLIAVSPFPLTLSVLKFDRALWHGTQLGAYIGMSMSGMCLHRDCNSVADSAKIASHITSTCVQSANLSLRIIYIITCCHI
jgi:hypothetical protein